MGWEKVEIDKRFGSLTVMEKLGTNDRHDRLWRCLCTCGKERTAVGRSLSRGSTTSCGCKGLAQGEGGVNRLLTSYQVRAQKRGIDWNLSKEVFWEQTSQSCFYCGTLPAMVFTSTGLKDRSIDDWSTYIYNGLDRLDNNMGYEANNVVSACAQCNKAKQDRSVNQFLEWIDILCRRFKESILGSIFINQRDIFSGPTLMGTTKGHAGFAKVFGQYKRRAKIADREWSLSKRQMWELTSSTCYYCGAEPMIISKPTGRKHQKHIDWGVYYYNGIDRIDNNKGYVLDNVVPCCAYCNRGKLDLKIEDFYGWIEKVQRSNKR